ncbi:hypothetical protein I4U23_011402 [Adineta vaga]|nr:hypothetical protein I4U23_011402 [Adineta vaga]
MDSSMHITIATTLINEDKYNIPILLPIFVVHMSQLACFGLQNKNRYIRPIIATLICGWLIARLLDGVDCCYKIDVVSVYFLIWQVMFVITKWELKQIAVCSPAFNRGSTIVILALGAFTAYDTICRYLSTQVSFIFFWMVSFADM